jgi:NADH:ubiquinone oxidoreductase subunit 4 (subunit M)
MVILIFLMGIYPKLFFSKMDASVEKFLKDVKGKIEMKADIPSPKMLAEIRDR